MENEYTETTPEETPETIPEEPLETNPGDATESDQTADENPPENDLENPEAITESDLEANQVEDALNDVSGSDVRTSGETISGNDIYYGEDINNNILVLSKKIDAVNDNLETLTTALTEPVWKKEFNSYTVTEAMLFITLLLVAMCIIWKLITDRKDK